MLMKKLCSALLVLLWCASGVLAADGQVLINGYNPTTKPFGYTENGAAKGFDIEMLNWIAQDAGVQIRHVPIVWAQGLDLIRRGEIDMIASSMTITVPRMIKVRFSNPYWNIDQGVLSRNDSGLTLEQVTSGRAQGVGAMRGSTGEAWYRSIIAKNNLDPEILHSYDDYNGVLNAVMNGEIQAGIMASATAKVMIGDRPMKLIGAVDLGEQYGVAMRKNNVPLHRLINHGLYKFVRSPEFEALKAKYNLN